MALPTLTITAGGGGTTLAVVAVDALTNFDIPIKAISTTPTFTQTAGAITVGTPMFDTVTYLPYICWPVTSAALTTGSTNVVANAPAGWATLTVGGVDTPAPALVNTPVDLSPIGRHDLLPPIDFMTVTMILGWNPGPDTYFNSTATWTDETRRAQVFKPLTATPLSFDASGNVASLNGNASASSTHITYVDNSSNPEDNKGFPYAPAGQRTAKWHGIYNAAKVVPLQATGFAKDADGTTLLLDSYAPVTPDQTVTNGSGTTLYSVEFTTTMASQQLLSTNLAALHPTGAATGTVGTTAFSIFFWIRFQGSDTTNSYEIYDKYDILAGNSNVELTIKSTNGSIIFKVQTNATGGNTLVSSFSALPTTFPGQYVFVECGFDGANLFIATNCVFSKQQTGVAGVFSGANNVRMGIVSGTAPRLDISGLGCVRGRNLGPTTSAGSPSAEALWLYNNGTVRASGELGQVGTGGANLTAGGGLLFYFDFTEAPGTTRNSAVGGYSFTDTLSTNVARIPGAAPIPLTDNTITFTPPVANNSNSAGVTGYGPQYQIKIVAAPLTNLHVYQPNSATDGSQEWHPSFGRRLAGGEVVRTSQPTQVASLTAVAHQTAADMLGGGYSDVVGVRFANVNVTSIGPPTVNFGWFSNLSPIEVACSSAHGFADFQPCNFGTMVGGDDPASNPGKVHIGASYYSINGYSNIVRVVDSTHFQTQIFGPGTGVTVSAPQAITGQVTNAWGQATPIDRTIRAATATRNRAWICLPWLASATEIGNLIADLIPYLMTASEVIFEYGNEHWNITFAQSQMLPMKAATNGITGAGAATYQYVDDAITAINAAMAALASAGWAGTAKKVLGSWSGVPTTTANLLARAQYHGWVPDAIAIAPYVNIGPLETSLKAAWDAFNAAGAASGYDAMMDLAALWVLHGGTQYQGTTPNPNGLGYPALTPRGLVASHYAQIASFAQTYPAYAGVKVYLYEFGIQYLGGLTAGATPSRMLGALSLALARHPRSRRLYQRMLKTFQDEGCPLALAFDDTGPPTDVSPAGTGVKATNGQTLAHYVSWTTLASSGDGSDGLYDNRGNSGANSFVLDRVGSVFGKAILEWNGAARRSKSNIIVTHPATIKAGSAYTVNLTGTAPAGGALLHLDSAVPGTWSTAAGGPAVTNNTTGTGNTITVSGAFNVNVTFNPTTTDMPSGVIQAYADNGTLWGAGPVHSTGLSSPAAMYHHRRRRVG